MQQQKRIYSTKFGRIFVQNSTAVGSVSERLPTFQCPFFRSKFGRLRSDVVTHRTVSARKRAAKKRGDECA